MNVNKGFGASLWAVILVIFAMTWSVFNQHEWTNKGIIQWDVKAYYQILPATFEYGDPLYNFTDSIAQGGVSEYWVFRDPNTGHGFGKTTIGLAYLYAPAYLLVKGYCSIAGIPAHNFDPPLQFSVALSTLLFSLLGLLFSRKVLLYFFSEKVTLITLLLLGFGTGCWHYTVMSIGYGHIFSFALFAMYMWQNIRYKETAHWKNFMMMAFLLGLTVIVRPSNSLIVLWTLFFVPESGFHLIKIFTFWLSRIRTILISLPIFFLPIIPQLILWKAITGHWIMYSYGDEGFFFLDPKLLSGLFGFRNGFFTYAPLLLLVFPGMYLLYKKNKSLFAATLTFMVINCYIIYSWWCWWYGGSFGSRPQVDSLLVTILPVAVCLDFLLNRKVFCYLVVLLVMLGCALNLFQSYQAKKAIIHWDSMTASAYKAIFLTRVIPYNYPDLIKSPDYTGALAGKEYPIEINKTYSEGVIKFSHQEEFPLAARIPADDIVKAGVDKIYATIYFNPGIDFSASTWLVVTVENAAGESLIYHRYEFYNPNHQRDTWHVARLEAPLPLDYMKPGSIIKAYIYNPSHQSFLVKNFKITNF